jgi:hypothetical protein
MQSERISCLHLVGLPSTQAFKQGKLLHHTLGDGNLGVFVGMSKAVGGGSAVGVIGLGSEGFGEEAWTDTVDRVMRVAMAEVSIAPKEFGQIGLTDQDVHRTRFVASTSLLGITSRSRLPKSVQPISVQPPRMSLLILSNSPTCCVLTDHPCSALRRSRNHPQTTT